MESSTQRRPSPRRAGSHARPTAGRGRRYGGSRGGVPIAVSFAPMIDVTFLLLIFFLVTTTFERAEGILSSKLPKEVGKKAVALPLSPIVIRLHQIGPDLEQVEIAIDNMEKAPSNFEKLTEVIQQIHRMPGFDRATPVVIVADADVRWDHVVACWNAALRAGCDRIAFSDS